MQTDTINISLGQFSNENFTPLQLADQILAARQAGFRVILKVDHLEGMAVLQQLPVVMEQQAARRLAMPRLISLALVASIAAVLVGVLGLAL